MVNLLPARGFRVQTRSAVVSDAGFTLDPQGNFTLEGTQASQLALSPGGFHGLTQITVTAPI